MSSIRGAKPRPISESTPGGKVRKAREILGMSASALSIETAIPLNVIYGIENNARSLVEVRRIVRLCEFLGIELKEFLGG